MKYVATATGELQCDPSSKGRTLQESKDVLAKLIGEAEIKCMTVKAVFVPLACGFPTGERHVFGITDEGYNILFNGVVGPLSFSAWGGDTSGCVPTELYKEVGEKALVDEANPKAQPLSVEAALAVASIQQVKTQVSDLIGLEFRVIFPDSDVTKDFIPNRVNIVTDESKRRIVDIWFG